MPEAQAQKRKRDDADRAKPSAGGRLSSKRAKTSSGLHQGTSKGPGKGPKAKSQPEAGNDGDGDESRALVEGLSVREEARPYLLAVAVMPLSVLTTTWTIGNNRMLDDDHIAELKASFENIGILRSAEEHRLRLLCSEREVQTMRQGIEATGKGAQGQRDAPLSFLDWGKYNKGRVEVMAGQHRIAALRQYLSDLGANDDEQLWWTCELYDKGVFCHHPDVCRKSGRVSS